jgi:hypothetical protein
VKVESVLFALAAEVEDCFKILVDTNPEQCPFYGNDGRQ